MKTISKAILSLLLLAGLSQTIQAENKETNPRNGAISGRVIDHVQQTLPGASIYIEKLQTGVISDINGFYTLPNLAPGTYTIKVTYVGYTPVETKLSVKEGKTLEYNIVMNEGMELQQIEVKGAFQGQKKAVNMQKNAMGVKNVVSADQVGKFPDSNIGDALKRINGINV